MKRAAAMMPGMAVTAHGIFRLISPLHRTPHGYTIGHVRLEIRLNCSHIRLGSSDHVDSIEAAHTPEELLRGGDIHHRLGQCFLRENLLLVLRPVILHLLGYGVEFLLRLGARQAHVGDLVLSPAVNLDPRCGGRDGIMRECLVGWVTA